MISGCLFEKFCPQKRSDSENCIKRQVCVYLTLCEDRDSELEKWNKSTPGALLGTIAHLGI